MKTVLALVAALLLPLAFPVAHAANDGELWESTIQMNIPGMPAGMGTRKQQVCSEKGDVKTAAQKGNEKCKVTDLKESGNKITMTMQCPEGTAVMEWNYNAAHTEYTGSMKMKTKDGDMNMTMAGKKLGACDVQAAQTARDQQTAQMQKRGAEVQASMAALNKQMEADKQKAFAKLKAGCESAVTKMDYHDLTVALCEGADNNRGNHCMSKSPAIKDESTRKQFQQYDLPAQDKAFCEAKKKEFCGNLQTEAGFVKAAKVENVATINDEGKRIRITAGERVPASAAYCGVKPPAFTTNVCSKAVAGESWGFLSSCPAEAKSASAKLCPRAVETEHYGYLADYCPVEAKTQYTTNCAGRDYTSMYQKADKKKFQMCMTLGASVEEDRQQAHSVPTSTKEAVDAAKQGAAQTINKIKGLFGK